VSHSHNLAYLNLAAEHWSDIAIHDTPNLTHVTLENFGATFAIPALPSSVTSVTLFGGPASLAPLVELSDLRDLILADSTYYASLRYMEYPASHYNARRSAVDLAPLSRLQQLRRLVVALENQRDFTPITQCPNLQEVELCDLWPASASALWTQLQPLVGRVKTRCYFRRINTGLTSEEQITLSAMKAAGIEVYLGDARY